MDENVALCWCGSGRYMKMCHGGIHVHVHEAPAQPPLRFNQNGALIVQHEGWPMDWGHFIFWCFLVPPLFLLIPFILIGKFLGKLFR